MSASPTTPPPDGDGSHEDRPAPDDRPPPTEFLLLGARAGSQSAWTELYARYRRMLIVTVEVRMPGSMRRRFDAEDVLQQAFSKAWEHLDEFRFAGEGSFRSWLRQIVLNEFQNQLKAQDAERRRVSRDEGGEHLDGVVAQEPPPSEILRAIEARRSLVTGMARLDEEDRELITLRLFEDMTWQQIGDIFRCSRELARKRFEQAIKRLTREVK